jgi:hypothetical protein
MLTLADNKQYRNCNLKCGHKIQLKQLFIVTNVHWAFTMRHENTSCILLFDCPVAGIAYQLFHSNITNVYLLHTNFPVDFPEIPL